MERLAREMQKAAEERPLIGERKGPYAMRENTIGGRLAQEPAQLKWSEEHYQPSIHALPIPWICVRAGTDGR